MNLRAQQIAEQEVVCGDALDVLRQIRDSSVDAVVTDNPYGLGDREPAVAEIVAYLTQGADLKMGGDFMNKKWDVPSVDTWRECLRVLKPGGYLLAFGGTRTFDLISLGIRAAGFEMRDTISCEGVLRWTYGQGFPHSLDPGREIDMLRCSLPGRHYDKTLPKGERKREGDHLCPAHPDGNPHRGEGTALTPGWEPILVFRKPMENTVAETVLEHGTGVLQIDACRIARSESLNGGAYSAGGRGALPGDERNAVGAGMYGEGGGRLPGQFVEPLGGWPKNVVLTHLEGCEFQGYKVVKANGHHPAARGAGGLATAGHVGQEGLVERNDGGVAEDWACVVGCSIAEMDAQSGIKRAGEHPDRRAADGVRTTFGEHHGGENQKVGAKNTVGGASRFYFCAKANRKERDLGCEHLPGRSGAAAVEREEGSAGVGSPRAGAGRTAKDVKNFHVSVKPLALMRWLVKLVAKPGSLIIDPFAGSGTTLCAAALEGVNAIGIEREPEYVTIAEARLKHWQKIALDT